MKIASVIVCALFVIFLVSCEGTPDSSDNSPDDSVSTGQAVASIQSAACAKADEVGSCYTNLVESGISSPEECCSRYNKCCGGELE